MDVDAAAAPEPASRRRRWTYAALGGWVLAVDAWFQGPLLGGRVPPATGAWLLLGLAIALGVRALRGGRLRPRSPALVLVVASMLLLATLVRLPALAAPGSLISSDSAV